MNGPPAGPSSSSTGESTIHTGYDWAQTSPMFAVLEAVSDAKSVRPTDLPPLCSSVDTDALNTLFERAPAEPNGEAVRVNFWYAGREVTIQSDGSVVVTPRQEMD